ncbi:MAG: peptidylprolyl isomerase [Ilumatobacteraceae bacterium]
MIRRSTIVAAAGAAVLLISSCSATDTSAAHIGDTTISSDHVAELATAYEEFQAATGYPVDSIPDGTIHSTAARSMLTSAIRLEILQRELAANDVTISQADLDRQSQDFADQFPTEWESLPEVLRDLSTRQAVASDAFQRLFAPDRATARSQYEQGPAASNVVCVSHILVDTEDQAAEVEQRLDDGEAFAEVAAALSTDPGSAATGGVLPNPNTGGACTDLGTFTSTYDQDFVQGALEATVGTPTAPVPSQFGYHIILLRPYDDVESDVLVQLGAANAAARQGELFKSDDIEVSPAFGEWDTANAQVVALGS